MKRRNEDGEKDDAGKRSLYSFFGEVTLPGCDPSCPSCTYKNVNTATTCHLCSTSLLPTSPTQATQENGGEDDRLASLEGGILTDASSTAASGFESPISRAWASSSSSASGTSPPASAPASAAPTDGAVLQWADTLVSITTRGLSAVNATIGLSIRSFQRVVDEALRRMDTRAEEAASQAASDVEAAKEEALKQMEVNAASLEAGIERANSAIEKLTEAKQSVRPPVLAGWLVGCLAACLPVCLAGWPRRHFFFLLASHCLPVLQVGPFVDIGAEYPWVSMKPSGFFVCDLCSAFHMSVVGYSSKTFGRGPSNPFLSQNGGASLGEAVSAYEFRRCFQKHESSVGHKLCLEAEGEAKKRNLLRNSLSDLDQRDAAVMMRLLMVMGHIATRKRPCLEYEHVMLLLEMTGEDVGGKCHGRKACAEMVGSSSDVMLLQLRGFVTTTNELMDHKPHVSAGADKMTDVSHDQWQPVNVRLNVRGTPTTVNVDLSPVDADYDAETAAGGFSMFNKLLESLEIIGLHLIVNGASIFDPANGQTSEQLRSVAFDNELCYQGKDSGVRHYFHDAADGYGDRQCSSSRTSRTLLTCWWKTGRGARWESTWPPFTRPSTRYIASLFDLRSNSEASRS